jgi:hypothetical protein
VTRPTRISIALTALSILTGPAAAQAPAQEPPGAADLAKQLANPIASLISVSTQMNWNFGVGPDEEMQTLVNFQPVMPFALSEDVNLIWRLILPYVAQPPGVGGGTSSTGFGDIVTSLFFSPAKPKGAIWGVGPALSIPMSEDPLLGSGKWGIGPTVVVLKQTGGWTYGALANQIWSVAGNEDRTDVSQTFLQPFIAYATKSAWTYTVNAEASANWEAAEGEEWTVPIHLQVTKLTRLGRRPVSVGGGVGYYVEAPTGGPEWKARFIFVLLYPK